MKKQIILTSILTIFMFIFLTSCSNKIDESTIMKDIKAPLSKTLSNNKIDDVEILEYNEEDEKHTSISIKVTSSDDVSEYIDYFMVRYYYFDEQWNFDNISQIHKDKSTCTPKRGVNEKIIKSSIDSKSITINDESWNINSSSIKNLSIETQNTDLDKKTDQVIVNITLEDVVQAVEGKIVINYSFDDEWEFESMSKDGEFKVTEKPDRLLNLSDDDLINELTKNEINLFDNTDNSQTISVKKSEISDFQVYKKASTHKGSYKQYYCKGTITKPIANFKFDATITYYYTDNWIPQPLSITVELDSIDIEGMWKGTYNGAPYDGKSSLKITKVTDDGKVDGVYGYTPEKINEDSNAGSYKVSGTLDKNDFSLRLKAGDWVVEDPSALSISKIDIFAYIYLNESEIEGTCQEGNVFNLKREK